MKETKECPYCGEEILATAKKCKHCGEWLTENKDDSFQQEKEKIPCPVCAEMIEANSKVCPYCNEPLHQKEEIKTHDVSPAVDATPKRTSQVVEVTDTTPESLSGFFKSYFWDPYVVHLFDFKGKISRKQYWMGALACTIVAVILGISILLASVIELAFLTIILAIPGILFLFIAQIGAISTTVRRFNDIGKSPWWYFVAIVPVVGSIYLIYLLAQKGETNYPKVKHNRLDLAVIGYVVLVALVVFIQDLIATSSSSSVSMAKPKQEIRTSQTKGLTENSILSLIKNPNTQNISVIKKLDSPRACLVYIGEANGQDSQLCFRDLKSNKNYYLDSGKVTNIQGIDVMLYSIDDAIEFDNKIFFSAYNGGNSMFAKYYLLALDMATMQLKFIDICDNIQFVKNKNLIKATKEVLVKEGSCAAENEYDFRDYYFNVEEIASTL